MAKWKTVSRRKKLPISVKLLLFAAVLIALLFMVEARLSPIIEANAMQQAHNLALSEMAPAIKRQVSSHPKAGNYHTLMHIERDEMGKIVLMAADVQLLNSFVSDLVLDLDQALDELDREQLRVPLLAGTGSKILSSLGPKVPVGISGIATPPVELTDSFVSAGINQVKHSIYLNVEARVQVTIPFSEDTCTVSTEILLAEAIIIGDIPDTYVQFDSSGLKLNTDN